MSTPDLAQLQAALPAAVRRRIYATYAVIAVIVSTTQVGFAAIPGGGQPVWLIVTLAVVAFLGTPIGILAATNTPATDARRALDADGDGQPDIAG